MMIDRGRYAAFERTEVVKIVPCVSDENSNGCISRTSTILSVQNIKVEQVDSERKS